MQPKRQLSDAKELAVREFLQKVKSTITNPIGIWKGWVLVRRSENIDCMTELGFTYQSLHDAILSLSVTDYCEGPVQDRDMRGDFWIFGKIISSKEVYIKLKLANVGNLKVVRIVSFHEANRPLRYPLQAQNIKEEKT